MQSPDVLNPAALDDRAINQIFGCGLTLAGILGRPDINREVARRLHNVIEQLDGAVTTMRRAAVTRASATHRDTNGETPDPPAPSHSIRTPAAEIRVTHVDGRRRLCRFAADTAFAYAQHGHDFYRASDHVLWAHESDGLLLSARSGSPFARRDGHVFYDLETNLPLYYEDIHIGQHPQPSAPVTSSLSHKDPHTLQ